VQSGWYDRRQRRVRDLSSGPFRIYLQLDIRRLHCRHCGTVKREGLDRDTVKDLDQQYMRAQLKRAGTPGPKAIGIDEISIREGHTYQIVVSDLERRRPIWFGGADRSEASLDEFYRFLGEKKARKIRLAVMDM